MDQTLKRLTIFGVLFMVYFLGALLIQSSALSGWIAHTTITHTLIQSIATVIALFCGIAALYQFNASGRSSSILLFIGVGFLGAAFIDAYHTIVSTAWFKGIFPKISHSLAEWSWLSTRSFLALLFLMSLPSLFKTVPKVNVKAICVSVSIVMILIFVLFVLIRVEYFVYPENFISRPLELIPGVLFLITLIGYLIQGKWKTDKLEFWIVLFLITSVSGQFFYVAFSRHAHDTLYLAAHIMKILSYFMIYTAVSD